MFLTKKKGSPRRRQKQTAIMARKKLPSLKKLFSKKVRLARLTKVSILTIP